MPSRTAIFYSLTIAALSIVIHPSAASPLATRDVTTQSVRFTVDGVGLTGTLYRPRGVAADHRLPGVVVTGAWTTVEEQMPRRYALALAQRGLTALTFDFRYWGDSGGQPRYFESPEAKITDIRAAAAFLAQQPGVARVGGLSICASSGYMAHAAAQGDELAAFATIAAWLHDTDSAKAVYGDRYRVYLEQGRKALEHYQETGEVRYVPAYAKDNPDAAMSGDVGYYGSDRRGAIPEWTNRFAQMSWVGWLTFDALSAAEHIDKPVLMIHSDHSALPDNARRFFNDLAGDKRLYWMQGGHLDFYDRDALVNEAADAVAMHMHRSLAGDTPTTIPAEQD